MNIDFKNSYCITPDGLVRPFSLTVGSPIAPKLEAIANVIPAKPVIVANIAMADAHPVSLIAYPDRCIVAQLRPNIRLFSRWTPPNEDGIIRINPHERLRNNSDEENILPTSELVSRTWATPTGWALLYAAERYAGNTKAYLFICSMAPDSTTRKYHLLRPPFPNIHEEGRLCCPATGTSPIEFLQSAITVFSDAPCCSDLARSAEQNEWVSYRVNGGQTTQVYPPHQPVDTLRAVSTTLTDNLSGLLTTLLEPAF